MKLIAQSGKYKTIGIDKIDQIKTMTIEGERPVLVAFSSDELVSLSNRSIALFNIAMSLQGAEHKLAGIPDSAPKDSSTCKDLNL